MSNQGKTHNELLACITELELENNLLRTGFNRKHKTVSVPEVFEQIFDKAQITVQEYFSNTKWKYILD